MLLKYYLLIEFWCIDCHFLILIFELKNIDVQYKDD